MERVVLPTRPGPIKKKNPQKKLGENEKTQTKADDVWENTVPKPIKAPTKETKVTAIPNI